MTEEKQGIYVRLPKRLWERVKELARKHRRSAAAEAAVALEEYLRKHQAQRKEESR